MQMGASCVWVQRLLHHMLFRLMPACVDLQDICVGATGARQMPLSGWQELCVSWVVWTPMCV